MKAAASPPASITSAISSSHGLMSHSASRQPSSASTRAVASPCPEAAPVIRATLPVMSRLSLLSLRFTPAAGSACRCAAMFASRPGASIFLHGSVR